MSEPFKVGTKVRLTGKGWDGLDGTPASGTVVTITQAPDEVEPGSAGGFLLAHDSSGGKLPWYVDREGFWAAEIAEPDERVTRAKALLQEYGRHPKPASAREAVLRGHRLASTVRQLLDVIEED